MSSTFSRIGAGLGRRVRRRHRSLRWLGTAALVVIGIIVFIPGTDDSNATDNISFAAALPIWLLAATWPVWRAPDREAPEGLRWRRRHRRICWRVSALTLFGSCFALLSCAYWEWRRDSGSGYVHYDHLNHLAEVSGTTALWLLLLSPLPGLLDYPLWPLWPASLRRAATQGKLAEELMRPNRFRLMPARGVPAPGFDPDRGWLGRPTPLFERLPAPERGAPLTIRPSDPAQSRGRTVGLFAKNDGGPWTTHASIAWDGESLTFTDGRQQRVSVPITQAAELVEVHEIVSGGYDSLLLLLDAAGRCTVSMPDVGFLQHEAATVAGAAGIPFARYELGRSDSRAGSMRARLFPAAPEVIVLQLH